MDSQLYHPLKSSRSIRLLHIDDGHLDDPIRASFEEVELDISLSYHALSYTWGSGEAVESIHIQDNVLSVLPNLFDALKKLRANRYTPIWIDRICINQGDDDEKTSQVMLMRDIYRSAKLVLVDLG
ncbi:HET-domain-containing protein, partial [Hyaloscypha hepaticicola]